MLREQTISTRAGREARAKGRFGDFEQRPQRRAANKRASEKRKRGEGAGRARALFVWFARRWRLMGKLVLAVGLGAAVFAAYRAAASASFFQVREIEVAGATRANANEIKTIVKRMVAPVGVWRADLDAVSAAIKKQQTWVKEAIVSRVLPSGIRVRVAERTPEAVIRTSAGRLVWIDAEGVMLGAASNNAAMNFPPMPPVLIRGWDESETDDARADNRERLAVYHEMLDAWTKAGIVERVSEVNLGDLHDVRAQLAGDDAQVEVRLGKEKFGERLERALKVLSDMKASGRYALGAIAYLNAAQAGRIIVGFNANAPQNVNDADARVQNPDASTPVTEAMQAKTPNDERAEKPRAKSSRASASKAETGNARAANAPLNAKAQNNARDLTLQNANAPSGAANQNRRADALERARRVQRETP
jgi:hypothetical protein